MIASQHWNKVVYPASIRRIVMPSSSIVVFPGGIIQVSCILRKNLYLILICILLLGQTEKSSKGRHMRIDLSSFFNPHSTFIVMTIRESNISLRKCWDFFRSFMEIDMIFVSFFLGQLTYSLPS